MAVGDAGYPSPDNFLTSALFRRWVAAGALVAFLDGLFAIVLFSTILKLGTPVQVFQGVAKALIGQSAFQGGLATAALGLCLHCCVAFSWAGAYAIALRISPGLRQFVSTHAGVLVVGALLGAIVWLAMDLVILPFTHAVPRPAIGSTIFISELIGHMIIVGPPIARIIHV